MKNKNKMIYPKYRLKPKYFFYPEYLKNKNLEKKCMSKIKIVVWMYVVATVGVLIAVLALVAFMPKSTATPIIEENRSHKPTQQRIHADKAVYGVASTYDYCLDSGWCSSSHMVCAVRHINNNPSVYPIDVEVDRGEYIKVIDLETEKWIKCLVTDYGPDSSVHPDRVVDLSSAAFSELKPLRSGLIKNVKIEYDN